MKQKKVIISLGSAGRFLSEENLYTQFRPLGLTLRGFRAWMRSMQVPTIEIGKTRIYELTTVLLALRGISRLGEPDFLTPGCETLRRCGKPPKGCTREYPLWKFRRDMKEIIAEFLLTKKLSGVTTVDSVREAAEKAAERMVLAGYLQAPSAAQAEYDAAALKLARKEGLLDAQT